jgi:3-hydroxybutyryl-CoA dehydrogenase
LSAEARVAITKLGVVGVGLMGSGIVQVAAQSGLHVVACDQSAAHDARARAGIEKQLGKLVERAELDAGEARSALERIEWAVGVAALADCDAVIEAIPEDQPRSAFRRADAACGAGAPDHEHSSISVTALVGRTSRRARVSMRGGCRPTTRASNARSPSAARSARKWSASRTRSPSS